MNEAPAVRAYQPADQPTVLELLRLNTPQYFAPEEEGDLLHYLQQEREQYFVVEEGGNIVGCGGLNFSADGRVGKISWDIFHPAHQGKGLGSLLLQYRLQKLKATPRVQAITVRTSQLVYPFYQKNGFELKAVVKDYWAPGFDMYFMEYKEASKA